MTQLEQQLLQALEEEKNSRNEADRQLRQVLQQVLKQQQQILQAMQQNGGNEQSLESTLDKLLTKFQIALTESLKNVLRR